LELLFEFSDCVSKGSEDTGLCKQIKCKILVEPSKTCNTPLRPLRPHLKESFKEQLDAWLEKGIVERANDSCQFSSTLVPVHKKNGGIRWAVDFQNLNKITRKDRRPVLNVFDKLASLKADTQKSFRYFASLDLQDAFHNIEMADEQSKDATAIITPYGLYRFLQLPFGLASAPNVFSDIINLLLEKIQKIYPKLAPQILVYFDDGLICAQDWREFLQVLRLFLQALRRMGLKLNAKKCNLAVSSIKWLDHKVSDQGICPDSQLV
jgi:Reverse transcriptase (RNA-dependent DNA polymerase)